MYKVLNQNRFKCVNYGICNCMTLGAGQSLCELDLPMISN